MADSAENRPNLNTPDTQSIKRESDNQRNEKETELWSGSFSIKAMYGTWICDAIATVAVLFLCISWPLLGGLTWLYGLIAMLILWGVTASIYCYRRLAVKYIVTTQRLIHQRGILVRTTDRIELIDVDDISFSQGLIQRVIGVGTITISGSDKTDPVLVMQGIEDVAKVAMKIDDARRSERRKHSLHIETV